MIGSWNSYCLKAHPMDMIYPWNIAGLLQTLSVLKHELVLLGEKDLTLGFLSCESVAFSVSLMLTDVETHTHSYFYLGVVWINKSMRLNGFHFVGTEIMACSNPLQGECHQE